ncbi:MAG: DUF4384 domain-containing protein [Prevotella sp.]|nr:DUF4384 domain-containing protein [Prevotella sp.]
MFLILLFSFSFLFSSAQKIKKVEGAYTYHVPVNVSLDDAKRTALERAKIQALADEFGTIVTQSNTTRIENSKNSSASNFFSVGGSEVKGEWIETTDEPKFDVRYDDDMLVVTCTVKGKARELVTAQIDISVKILKNGIDSKNESDTFMNGDEFFLSFLSPVKGFLAAYLVDSDNHVFCLLPYRVQDEGIYPIKANQQYIFFNTQEAEKDRMMDVDEYYMTCSQEVEHNQLYVIFSPNEFVKAKDMNMNERLPRELPFSDFQKWLTKCRKYDQKMNIRIIPITIKL